MKELIYLSLFVFFIACQSQPGDPATTQPGDARVKPAIDSAFLSLFEEINVVKMHLFATQDTAPTAESYPYAGKPIEGDMLKYLDVSLQPNEVGGVFARYHLENNGMFILRVPGKYVAGDLALARWDDMDKKLKRVSDLAYIQCDEGICHQQDAWLTDLDDSRTLELVTRSRSTDAGGKIIEEHFIVMTDDGKVGFVKTDEKLASLAVKEHYVMINSR
jgi:hypothetical protein